MDRLSNLTNILQRIFVLCARPDTGYPAKAGYEFEIRLDTEFLALYIGQNSGEPGYRILYPAGCRI